MRLIALLQLNMLVATLLSAVVLVVPDVQASQEKSFGLEVFAGSELVEQEAGKAVLPHLVILGALEKVNHQLESEKSEVVTGMKSSETYYLPQVRRTGEVRRHYSAQLENLGEIVFECKGRSCGSSSFWANRIFDRAILYGPEQYQHYYVMSLPENQGYLSVYIGQRATRKVYVHIEQVLRADTD